MTLRVVPGARKHDLPPSWDGERVEWQGWSENKTSMRYHGKPERCDGCRSEEEATINLGLVHPKPGETITVFRERTLKRSGRKITKTVQVDAYPILWLVAFRCPSCGMDSVWDKRDDTWWDLDPSDYGDEGSTDGALPGL